MKAGFFGNLSLLQRELILIAVPLAFELIFVAVLGGLFYVSNAQLSRAASAAELTDRTTILLMRVLDAVDAQTTYYATKSARYMRKYEELASLVPQDVATVKAELNSDPKGAQAFSSVERNVHMVLDWMDKLHTQMVKGKTELSALDLWELKKILMQTRKNLDSFIAYERSIANERPVVQARMQNYIWFALADGVAINVLIAVWLARYLYRINAVRLNSLLTHIQSFARGKPLGEPIDGSDEIAQLDRVFNTMAQSLNEAAEKERDMEKMKQEFVAMVSHDLKTPLTSIRGTLMLLTNGVCGELPPNAKEMLSVSEAELERLTNLVKDLLDLAKIEAGRMQLYCADLSIDALVRRSIASVSQFAINHQIELDYDSTTGHIEADRDRLVQVFVNLLTNAIKFSSAKGKVQIRIDEAESGFVTFRVIDDGRGVPEDKLESIFEPYRQVEGSDEREKDGTGLGLPICKKIVEQHGGTIGVTSVCGQGSTFWFRIPRKAAETGSAAAAHESLTI